MEMSVAESVQSPVRRGPSRRTQKILETRRMLVERFPNAFCPKGAVKKPLKVGIRHDLIAAAPQEWAWLGAALADYCGGPLYLRSVVEGAERVDLDGNVVGIVTECEARYSAKKLERLNRGARKGKGCETSSV